MNKKPNVLFIMTDQQRFDTIAALGNNNIYTPNLDRLVKRGISFTNAYSSCPVCVPARYIIRTGCEPTTTGVYLNGPPHLMPGQAQTMEKRCGPYLAREMKTLGYRTFGIGKFHTFPQWDEDLGYDVHLHTEEIFFHPGQRDKDAYASFIREKHPHFDFIEARHGERTEMYYMPQTSPVPAEITVEAFVADRAIEQIRADESRPYFGLVSFIGPHPPFAPPIPYNRMYDPDKMTDPVCGDIKVDHMDDQIPWMNYAVWAEQISPSRARVLKARYYGEISYIDQCIGRILDAVQAGPDPDNTLICFFADHGDHFGNHHAWQKESFFEDACHIPFLLSWPAAISANTRCEELISLTDLFAIATGAAGGCQPREGIDVLRMLKTGAGKREYLFGYYGKPGTIDFKIMVRDKRWKYIFMANGGREQLFDLLNDPEELRLVNSCEPDTLKRLRAAASEKLSKLPCADLILEKANLKAMPFQRHKPIRIYQFEGPKAPRQFPDRPGDALKF